MQLANSKDRYGLIPQAVHWLTAVCVIAGWLLGWFHDALPRGAPRAVDLFLHMTLGQCVIALLVVRLAWRMVDPSPPLELTRFGRLAPVAAKISHFTLYALLLAVPILGIIVQLKRGNALPILGLWDVASPWPADRAVARTMLQVHEYLAHALLILAGLHAVAAIVHHWVLRDRTLLRMLPAQRGASGAKAEAVAPLSP